MRDDILEASIRVLQNEGAARFTTPRVATAAGVSIGSLYQYFPNKQALLIALHRRVIEATWRDVQRVLDHPRWTAAEKVRRIAVHFFRIEASDMGEMGPAFREIEASFAGRPEQRALEQQVLRRFTKLTTSRFGAELLVTVLEAVGKSVAQRPLSPRQRDRWARATADMLASFLFDGAARARPGRQSDMGRS